MGSTQTVLWTRDGYKSPLSLDGCRYRWARWVFPLLVIAYRASLMPSRVCRQDNDPVTSSTCPYSDLPSDYQYHIGLYHALGWRVPSSLSVDAAEDAVPLWANIPSSRPVYHSQNRDSSPSLSFWNILYNGDIATFSGGNQEYLRPRRFREPERLAAFLGE